MRREESWTPLAWPRVAGARPSNATMGVCGCWMWSGNQLHRSRTPALSNLQLQPIFAYLLLFTIFLIDITT